MDILEKLLHEIFKDAYLQGRHDGLEGIHIEPQVVLHYYLIDSSLASRLTELGCLSELLTNVPVSDIRLH